MALENRLPGVYPPPARQKELDECGLVLNFTQIRDWENSLDVQRLFPSSWGWLFMANLTQSNEDALNAIGIEGMHEWVTLAMWSEAYADCIHKLGETVLISRAGVEDILLRAAGHCLAMEKLIDRLLDAIEDFAYTSQEREHSKRINGLEQMLRELLQELTGCKMGAVWPPSKGKAFPEVWTILDYTLTQNGKEWRTC